MTASKVGEIELKVEALQERCRAIGVNSPAEIARFLNNMDQGHLSRILSGFHGPGERFITRVLTAPWPEPVVFDDFFRVRQS